MKDTSCLQSYIKTGALKTKYLKLGTCIPICNEFVLLTITLAISLTTDWKPFK